MASETVLDYLGHPCEIAKARDLFDEPLKAARKIEARPLCRDIGRYLNELTDRDLNANFAIDLALTLAQDVDGPNVDGLRALLEMMKTYAADSSSMMFNFSGNVLAALERGKLVEVAHA